MSNKDLTLRIINNTEFPKVYGEFLQGKEMCQQKYKILLSIAILFLNSNNENVIRLGYRIIVMYCNQSGDYKPLYDVATHSGLIPVSQFIEDKIINDKYKNVFTELNAAFNKNFVINDNYCTLQQKELIVFYNDNQDMSVSVVAPTSYGKTDLIIQTVKNNKGKNVCVITPKKSLLLQTKARIAEADVDLKHKIITHPEMYTNKDQILAVMTQERVLRLLKKEESLCFDQVIIDEAHELLQGDDRNTLLASVIIILLKRNPKTIFKFLTPFLCDANSIKIRYTDLNYKVYKVDEYIKTEKIYIANLRDRYTKNLLLYDQFNDILFSISRRWMVCKDWQRGQSIVRFNYG